MTDPCVGIRATCCALVACLCLSDVCVQADDTNANGGKEKEALRRSLRELDRFYAGVLPWLAKLYDPESGGFFINLSAKKQGGEIGPDIQSTAQARGFLWHCGLMKEMPESFRRKLIAYYQSRQDPATGFFIDPHYPQMKDNPRVLGRALGFSTSALRVLKAKPLYPLPGESRKPPSSGRPGKARTRPTPGGSSPRAKAAPSGASAPRKRGAAALPEHLRSPERFQQWLKDLPWENAWAALDRLQSQTSILKSMPEADRKLLVDLAYACVAARQDPKTGLWPGRNPIDGAAKFSWFCAAFGLKMPRADLLARSVVDWCAAAPPQTNACKVGNPIRLLAVLNKRYMSKPLPPKDLLTAIEFCKRSIAQLRQADGGFAMSTTGRTIAPNDIVVGRTDGPEGNVNGSAQIMLVRLHAYQMAGIERPPLPGADSFYASLPSVGGK